MTLRAGAALDLGGIGKAWIAQRTASVLERLSVDEQLLINAGGDLLAVRGEHTAGVVAVDGEWVGLRAGEALATSGYSQRQWVTGDGQRAHHLIDPVTGGPGPLVHATVLAGDPVTADVMAKVLALRPHRLYDSPQPALLVHDDRVERNDGWRRLLHAPPPAETARQ